MGMKKGVCLLLACIVSMGCLAFPAGAFDIEENVTEITERRATGHFDFEIPANTLMRASTDFPMEYAYVYVDEETGGFNNSTWYAMQSSSGRIDVYN